MESVLIMLSLVLAIVLFQIVFTQIVTNPYKKIYYELILKLSENPNDTELKNRTLEAANKYYSRIRGYTINNRGLATSIKLMPTIDEKTLYEDMISIIDKERNLKH